MITGIIAFVVFFLGLLLSAIRVLREYERGVVFRLGRVLGAVKGPGLIFLIPFVDKMERIDLRVITMDIPSQDVITKDNVSVKVNAVVYFRVINPLKAVIEVEDFLYATSQLAQTTLRSVLGSAELDDLLSERDKLNHDREEIIRKHSETWGINVIAMEIKHVDLPTEMQRAMAKQAEAERERRAKFTHATGELEASAALTEAAMTLSKNPIGIQLRYLQALIEVAAEKNSTIVFPMPIDLLSSFIKPGNGKDDG